MVKASSLLPIFQTALDEKWGYIWGTSGQLWTESTQRNVANRRMPASSLAMAKKYGSKWIGRKVSDCSGLFYMASKKLGFNLPHGSNSIFKSYCTQKGKLTAETRMKPGYAVFLYDGKNRHHIGLYMGNDTVIEAKGTAYGVVTSKLSHWDEWGALKGVDYTEEEEDMPVNYPVSENPTLMRGSCGDAVRRLQTILERFGLYTMGVDGVYGSGTVAAVRCFQADHGLATDGVCGQLTWAAILAAEEGAIGNGAHESNEADTGAQDMLQPERPIVPPPSVTDSTDTEDWSEEFACLEEDYPAFIKAAKSGDVKLMRAYGYCMLINIVELLNGIGGEGV